MKKVAVLSFKPLFNDPRIYRQVEWLKEDYQVFTLGPKVGQIPGVPCVDCGFQKRSLPQKIYRALLLIRGQYDRFYWDTPHIRHSLIALRKEQPDLILANELECLPLALQLKKEFGTRVIFDAHEYYPDYRDRKAFLQKPVNKYFTYLCHKYLASADLSMSVSDGINQKYISTFGVQMELITNAPSYTQLLPSSTSGDHIRLIHHGLSMPDRLLEETIALMSHLDDRFELNLMLLPSNKYLDKLKALAKPFGERIHFLDPVPMTQISTFIQQFDMGIFYLPPIHFSYQYALPNKFFEFIQGRLGVAIGPSIEMQKIVEAYKCGVVSQSFSIEALAKKMNALTKEDVEAFKIQADKASQILNAEANGEKMKAWVRELL